jgi:hypothetical protein
MQPFADEKESEKVLSFEKIQALMVGSRISVWRDGPRCYDGTIADYKCDGKERKISFYIHYDAGDKLWTDLHSHTWCQADPSTLYSLENDPTSSAAKVEPEQHQGYDIKVDSDSNASSAAKADPDQEGLFYEIKAQRSLESNAVQESLGYFVQLQPSCTFSTARKEIFEQLIPEMVSEKDEWRFLFSKQLGRMTLQQETTLTIPSDDQVLVLLLPRVMTN